MQINLNVNKDYNSLHISHGLHHIGLTLQILGHPIKCGHMPLPASQQNVSPVLAVIQSIGSKLGQVELKVLCGARNVHRVANVCLADPASGNALVRFNEAENALLMD